MKSMLLGLVCLVSAGVQALEYEPQFENDLICISRVKIQPQEEIGLHRDVHPQVVIALKGGTITRLEADGREIGPVHTMFTDANGCTGAPIKAPDEGKTGCLREEGNAEWRPRAPVPYGLRRQRALRFVAKPRRAAGPSSFCVSPRALFARNASREHGVSRP